jgi:hypothetical protein
MCCKLQVLQKVAFYSVLIVLTVLVIPSNARDLGLAES